MTTLKAYEKGTISFHRSGDASKSLSWIGKHEPQWLRSLMEEAGANTHFIRGASCSTAAGAGITTKDILDATD